MIRRLMRWMVGPVGRVLAIALLVAAAWAAWWVWPEQPIRTFELEEAGGYWQDYDANPKDHFVSIVGRYSSGPTGHAQFSKDQINISRLDLATGQLKTIALSEDV